MIDDNINKLLTILTLSYLQINNDLDLVLNKHISLK